MACTPLRLSVVVDGCCPQMWLLATQSENPRQSLYPEQFVPITVTVVAPLPAFMSDGLIEVTWVLSSARSRSGNAEFADVPPGSGLVTVMLAVPTVVMSLARIAAVNLEEVTNVVVRTFPLNTVAPLTNPVPFTVRVNATPPAIALFGESKVTTGTAFVPVPLSGSACGLSAALSATNRFAVLNPVPLGENATVIRQLLFGGKLVLLQLSLLIVKSERSFQ